MAPPRLPPAPWLGWSCRTCIASCIRRIGLTVNSVRKTSSPTRITPSRRVTIRSRGLGRLGWKPSAYRMPAFRRWSPSGHPSARWTPSPRVSSASPQASRWPPARPMVARRFSPAAPAASVKGRRRSVRPSSSSCSAIAPSSRHSTASTAIDLATNGSPAAHPTAAGKPCPRCSPRKRSWLYPPGSTLPSRPGSTTTPWPPRANASPSPMPSWLHA